MCLQIKLSHVMPIPFSFLKQTPSLVKLLAVIRLNLPKVHLPRTHHLSNDADEIKKTLHTCNYWKYLRYYRLEVLRWKRTIEVFITGFE